MSIPNNIAVLSPWQTIEASDQAKQLATELEKELAPGHALYGKKVQSLAMRVDRDDVLFEVEGATLPLAVVHLTWSRESDLRWPTARLFKSWEHWLQDEMYPAHEEYNLETEDSQ